MEIKVPEWAKRPLAVFEEFGEMAPGTHASSIAYFMFLSLIPLVTLSISLTTMLGLGEQEVADFLCALVPGAFDGFVRPLIHDAFSQSGVALSLSTVTLLMTSSQGVRALLSALNAAYRVDEKRNPIHLFVLSIAASAVLVALLAAAIYLVFGGLATRALTAWPPGFVPHEGVLDALGAGAAIALGVAAICGCYTHLPSGSRRFVQQLPGALLAFTACAAITLGFRIYVDNFCNFDALYGSIATVALFLFWLFVVSFVLIACAFLNHVLAGHVLRRA
jgi:membrane protein